MNSRRFSLGIICIVFLTALIVAGLAWILPEQCYMDGEYPYWTQQKDYVLQDADQQEILLLGDSRMKEDVFALEFHDDAYNLAVGGASPAEMYYSLKDYIEHHPMPKMVIVAFGPMHYDDEDTKIFTERNAYFHYFSYDRLIEVNNVYKELDGKDYSEKIVQYVYRMPSIYMKPILRSLVWPRTQENEDKYNEAVVTKGHMPNSTNQVTHVRPPEIEKNSFIPLESHTFYMNKIIEMCLDNDIEIHIEQLPMGEHGLPELEASGYMDEYRQYMKHFADQYGIDVNDDIPGYEDRYFGDVSHLNEEGAHKFTSELRGKYFSK